jgi:hypothetical protein
VSSRRAVLRAWGVPRTLLLAGLIALGVQLAARTYVGLPTFAAAIPVLDLVPPAAALVLAAPLVDQTPELTLRAGRPLWVVLVLRYAAVQGAGALVLASLALSPWTLARSLTVVLFLSGATVAAAALGAWYWVPVMGTSYAWLWRTQHLDDLGEADVGVLTGLGALVLAGLTHVAVGAYRVHRARCPRDSARVSAASRPPQRRRPGARCPRRPS